MRKIETGIWQMEDGRYRVRTTGKSLETGKIVSKEATVESIDEAREVREAIKRDIKGERGEHRIITLADYADTWLERKAKRLKKSTMTKNVRTLAHHILPRLGHIRLDKLTRKDVSEWVAWAERQQRHDGLVYSSDTVASWWRVLRNVARDAHAQGYIQEDITSRQETPHTGVSGRQEARTLTANDLARLVEAARTFTPTRYAEIVTLAYTGMRIGELYALTWADVDLALEQITVRKSVWRGSVGSTKTGASREVPLPSLVVETLKAHRAEQVRDQHPGLAAGIVFPATHGGHRESSSLRKALDLLSEHLRFEEGGKVAPQVLRRTYNTLLLKAKADRIVLRSIVGHSSEAMTQRYAGVGMDAKRTAIDRAFEPSLASSTCDPSPQVATFGEENDG